MSKFCGMCGKQLENEEKICKYCGYPCKETVSDGKSVQGNLVLKEVYKEQRKGKRLMMIVIIIVLFFILGAIVKNDLNSSPKSEKKDFQEALVQDSRLIKDFSLKNSNKAIDVEICDYGGMVLFQNGDLYTFGSSNDMALGRSDKSYKMTKILENIVEIEQGYNMAFAIDEEENLWGWCATNNQAWDNYLLDPLPKIMERNVKSVEASHTAREVLAIIKNDNSLWIWGTGTVGVNSDDGFVKILDNVKQVSVAGGILGSAVKEDNSVWIWGYALASGGKEEIKTTVPILYGTDIQYVYADSYLACVDQNNLMDLIPMGFNAKDPVRYDVINNVKRVIYDGFNGLYLGVDGNLYSWGKNRLSSGMGEDVFPSGGISVENAVSILSNIVDFDKSHCNAIAVDEKGKIYVWGQNMNHILGLNTEDDYIMEPTVLYPVE